MSTHRTATWTLIALGAASLIYPAQSTRAQQKPTSAGAPTAQAAGTLTAADYVEIQQLVARYAFALDTGADNGYMFADLFAPGATFGGVSGREAIAKLAVVPASGPLHVRNLSNLAIIKPSPEGATGILYVQSINFGEGARKTRTEFDHFGHYEDVFVKTADGWRFKSRTFVNESGSLRRPSERAPAAATPSR
jgi:hypothetical protein